MKFLCVWLLLFVRDNTSSDCQAGPVCQNQICLGKQQIQFCRLFPQTLVSYFSVAKPTLYDSESMLYLCPDR